jgi:hypothetical protein
MSAPLDFDVPHTALKIVYNRFQDCITLMRPYISESGLATKGPKAKPRRKMESVISCTAGSSMCSSEEIAGSAGAIRLTPKTLMKTNMDIPTKALALLLVAQFFGFPGSDASSCHVTYVSK